MEEFEDGSIDEEDGGFVTEDNFQSTTSAGPPSSTTASEAYAHAPTPTRRTTTLGARKSVGGVSIFRQLHRPLNRSLLQEDVPPVAEVVIPEAEVGEGEWVGGSHNNPIDLTGDSTGPPSSTTTSEVNDSVEEPANAHAPTPTRRTSHNNPIDLTRDSDTPNSS